MDACASLIVTNYRLVQEKTSWGRRTIREIPLRRLDSITYDYARSPGAILAGILLTLIGYLLALEEEEFFFVVLIGLLILIIGLLWKREFTEFKSATMTIREESRGLGELTNTLRKLIYVVRVSEPSQHYQPSSQENEISAPRILSISR